MQPDITGAIEAAAWRREDAKWNQAFADDVAREEREKREARDEAEIKCAASVVKCDNLRRGVVESLQAEFPEVEHRGDGAWWQVGPYIVAAWIGDNGLPYADVTRLSPEDAEKLGGAWRLKTFRQDVGACADLGEAARIGTGWVRVSINPCIGKTMIDVYTSHTEFFK